MRCPKGYQLDIIILSRWSLKLHRVRFGHSICQLSTRARWERHKCLNRRVEMNSYNIRCTVNSNKHMLMLSRWVINLKTSQLPRLWVTVRPIAPISNRMMVQSFRTEFANFSKSLTCSMLKNKNLIMNQRYLKRRLTISKDTIRHFLIRLQLIKRSNY